jgi:pyruvate/2-oxoglutarate dehydrogenase complex dihydrolipoamide dehydrogenase (E3) component
MREARQLGDYGIVVGEPALDYPRLLARARQVVDQIRHDFVQLHEARGLGIRMHEDTGPARFLDAHTVETAQGLRLSADRIILCTGGTSRRLAVPGGELCCTHSDAWGLRSVPSSMIIVGGGDTGLQVASIFNAFGTHVRLLQAGPRIIPNSDAAIAQEVANAMRSSGIAIDEQFGAIASIEKTAHGVRVNCTREGGPYSLEAALVVVAIGWVANTAALDLPAAGVALDPRGYVQVDECLQTTAPTVLAAGDVTGRLMLLPQAVQQGFIAAHNAVRGDRRAWRSEINPVGSFTDPEYAQVGLTEAEARGSGDAFSVSVPFAAVMRPVIDGRTSGLFKLVVDRTSQRILGAHIAGERAVELAQLAATAMAGRLRVHELARLPLSLPTYAGILSRAAVAAARECGSQQDDFPALA